MLLLLSVAITGLCIRPPFFVPGMAATWKAFVGSEDIKSLAKEACDGDTSLHVQATKDSANATERMVTSKNVTRKRGIWQ